MVVGAERAHGLTASAWEVGSHHTADNAARLMVHFPSGDA
jgi:hypothetical protein